MDVVTWKTSIWQQFGAAIDMLDNPVEPVSGVKGRRDLRLDYQSPESMKEE